MRVRALGAPWAASSARPKGEAERGGAARVCPRAHRTAPIRPPARPGPARQARREEGAARRLAVTRHASRPPRGPPERPGPPASQARLPLRPANLPAQGLRLARRRLFAMRQRPWHSPGPAALVGSPAPTRAVLVQPAGPGARPCYPSAVLSRLGLAVQARTKRADPPPPTFPLARPSQQEQSAEGILLTRRILPTFERRALTDCSQ